MTEESKQALPAKCKHCEKPMSTPVVCDFCSALNPVPTMTDHFSLLGLPRQFDLDQEQLRDKFLALNRHAHPDFHGGESADVQGLSLRISSAVNDAYRVLRDDATRAAYLLELLGGKSSASDKSVPDGFLPTMMMMQEELADAKAAANTAELGRIRQVLQTQHDGLMKRIAKLFQDHQDAVACNAVVTDTLDEIRKQLNAVSYVRKLLSQV